MEGYDSVACGIVFSAAVSGTSPSSSSAVPLLPTLRQSSVAKLMNNYASPLARGLAPGLAPAIAPRLAAAGAFPVPPVCCFQKKPLWPDFAKSTSLIAVISETKRVVLRMLT